MPNQPVNEERVMARKELEKQDITLTEHFPPWGGKEEAILDHKHTNACRNDYIKSIKGLTMTLRGATVLVK